MSTQYEFTHTDEFSSRGSWGALPERLGGGVRPASQNPYPNYEP